MYNDIIEVEAIYYYLKESTGEYVYRLTTVHYYAKGIGEVYHFYPYPVSLYYAHLSAFIMETKRLE